MAKKQHIADEDLVTESWPCSVDDRVDASASRLRDGLSGCASLQFQAEAQGECFVGRNTAAEDASDLEYGHFCYGRRGCG